MFDFLIKRNFLVNGFHREAIGVIVDAFPDMHLSLSVDDVGQLVIGDEMWVARILSRAAAAFLRAAKDLGLDISTKSTLVTNSPVVERAVLALLKAMGLRVRSAPYARDLGICFHAGRTRRPAIAHERLAKSKTALTQDRLVDQAV